MRIDKEIQPALLKCKHNPPAKAALWIKVIKTSSSFKSILLYWCWNPLRSLPDAAANMANPDPPKSAPPAPPATATATTMPTEQQPQSAPSQYKDPLIHNMALGITPIALGALFLPPRRLDLRQLMLGGVAVWGINRLVSDYSGRSFAQRFEARMKAFSGTELPEKALRTQELLRRERARRLEEEKRLAGGLGEQGAAAAAAAEKEKEEQARRTKQERGTLEALWMGDQGDDWKEKRGRREKEALQEGGGGYWGLISDHFAEAWNSLRKKENDAQDAEVRAKAEANAKEEEEKKKS